VRAQRLRPAGLLLVAAVQRLRVGGHGGQRFL
jgi:hypothetical protein